MLRLILGGSHMGLEKCDSFQRNFTGISLWIALSSFDDKHMLYWGAIMQSHTCGSESNDLPFGI